MQLPPKGAVHTVWPRSGRTDLTVLLSPLSSRPPARPPATQLHRRGSAPKCLSQAFSPVTPPKPGDCHLLPAQWPPGAQAPLSRPHSSLWHLRDPPRTKICLGALGLPQHALLGSHCSALTATCTCVCLCGYFQGPVWFLTRRLAPRSGAWCGA